MRQDHVIDSTLRRNGPRRKNGRVVQETTEMTQTYRMTAPVRSAMERY